MNTTQELEQMAERLEAMSQKFHAPADGLGKYLGDGLPHAGIELRTVTLAKALRELIALRESKAEATVDECIELAVEFERLRAIKIIEDVTSLPVGGGMSDAPTPFQAGYQMACEEIMHRLQTEEWELNLPPNVLGA